MTYRSAAKEQALVRVDGREAFRRLATKLSKPVAISLMSSMATQYSFWEVQVQRNRARAFRERVAKAATLLREAEQLAEHIEALSPALATRAAHHVSEREREAGWNSPKEKYEAQFVEPVRARRQMLTEARSSAAQVESKLGALMLLEAGQGEGPDFVLTFPSGGKRGPGEILCAAAATGARTWISRNSEEVAQTIAPPKGSRGPTRVTAVDVAYAAVALGIETTVSRQRWQLRLTRSTKATKRHPLLALQRGRGKPPGRMTIRHETPLTKRAREILDKGGPNAEAEAFELLMGFATWSDIWPLFEHLKQLRKTTEVLR